jgi:hypothetical protein
VVPLRLGGGTRLKIVEAMAMGRAIVSTSTGSRPSRGATFALRTNRQPCGRGEPAVRPSPVWAVRIGQLAWSGRSRASTVRSW